MLFLNCFSHFPLATGMPGVDGWKGGNVCFVSVLDSHSRGGKGHIKSASISTSSSRPAHELDPSIDPLRQRYSPSSVQSAELRLSNQLRLLCATCLVRSRRSSRIIARIFIALLNYYFLRLLSLITRWRQ